jgi:uncharacterized repeat protein (TIGR01451 family)
MSYRAVTLLIVVALLVVPACHTATEHSAAIHGTPAMSPGGLPNAAYTGPVVPPPPGVPLGPPGMEQGVPMPYDPAGPWVPPGIARPWPTDEYLCDGGDQGVPTGVTPEGEVRGLGMEDTVAHFDTLDGRTVVQASNKVCVYAPRFGAVRQVTGLVENEQTNRSVGVETPTRIVRYDDVRGPRTSKQNLPMSTEIGSKVLTVYESKQHEGRMSSALKVRALQDGFQAYENLAAIRAGMVAESEMAVLAKGMTAANVWSRNQAVQVMLDRQMAATETSDTAAGQVYTVKKPKSNPRIRVIKVASTQMAEPGDTISFTIRFDNMGNETIGNVTILDNLTTRLEYVPNTAQSSVAAQFFCQPNDGGSLVLRWEITEPLQSGKGGLVRFNCRVR